MALRWCAAGMVEAAKQFRRVNGYLHLPALRAALQAEVAATVKREAGLRVGRFLAGTGDQAPALALVHSIRPSYPAGIRRRKVGLRIRSAECLTMVS
jgi:hypothetical protein